MASSTVNPKKLVYSAELAVLLINKQDKVFKLSILIISYVSEHNKQQNAFKLQF